MASGRDLGKSDDDLVDFFRKYLGGMASSNGEMRLYDCTNYRNYFCEYMVDSMSILHTAQTIIISLDSIVLSIKKNDIGEVMQKIMPDDTTNIFLKEFDGKTLLQYISDISDNTEEGCKSMKDVTFLQKTVAQGVGINMQKLFDNLTLLLNYLSRPENMYYIVSHNQNFIIQMHTAIKIIDIQKENKCGYESYQTFKDVIKTNFNKVESQLKNTHVKDKANLDEKLKEINEKIVLCEKIITIPDDEPEIRESLINYFNKNYGSYTKNTLNLLYKQREQIKSELDAANKEKNSQTVSQPIPPTILKIGSPEYIARQNEQYKLLQAYNEEVQRLKLAEAKKRGAARKTSRKKSTKKRKQKKSKKSRSKKI